MSAVAPVVGLLAGAAVVGATSRPRRPRRLDDLVLGARDDAAQDQRVRGRPRIGVDDLRRDPRACAVALVVVISCWLVHPVVAVVVIGAVTAIEPLAVGRAARRRDTEIRASLPDVIDLFRSSVDAGLTVGGAIDAVTSRTDGAWRDALLSAQRQVALGERRSVALHELDRLGDVARPLARALIASERDGAPLVLALDALARDARLERRREAEERARRLPIQLLFPLVLCILPAFGLLTIVPLLAGTLPSLSG